MQKLLIGLTALSLAAPVATTARASMTVTPAGPNSFYVSGVPTQTPGSHWCAAAEYARDTLGADFSQRMYVVGGQKRGERRVLISMSPEGTASETNRVRQTSIRIDGANRRVNAGLADCRDLRRWADL